MSVLLKFAVMMALGIALTILLALAIGIFTGSVYLMLIKGIWPIGSNGHWVIPWAQGPDGLAFTALGFVIGWSLGMLSWRAVWNASERFR
jgi:hypothetical protein